MLKFIRNIVSGAIPVTGVMTGTSLESVARFLRPRTVGSKWNSALDVKLGTYAAGVNAQSKAVLALSNAAIATPDTDIMALQANGLCGVWPQLTPLSNWDTGSLGVGCTVSAAAAYSLQLGDHTLYLNGAATQAVTLPAASTVARRIVRLVNPMGVAKTVTSYADAAGVASTAIPARSVVVLQSTGGGWVYVGGSWPVMRLASGATAWDMTSPKERDAQTMNSNIPYTSVTAGAVTGGYTRGMIFGNGFTPTFDGETPTGWNTAGPNVVSLERIGNQSVWRANGWVKVI